MRESKHVRMNRNEAIFRVILMRLGPIILSIIFLKSLKHTCSSFIRWLHHLYRKLWLQSQSCWESNSKSTSTPQLFGYKFISLKCKWHVTYTMIELCRWFIKWFISTTYLIFDVDVSFAYKCPLDFVFQSYNRSWFHVIGLSFPTVSDVIGCCKLM